MRMKWDLSGSSDSLSSSTEDFTMDDSIISDNSTVLKLREKIVQLNKEILELKGTKSAKFHYKDGLPRTPPEAAAPKNRSRKRISRGVQYERQARNRLLNCPPLHKISLVAICTRRRERPGRDADRRQPPETKPTRRTPEAGTIERAPDNEPSRDPVRYAGRLPAAHGDEKKWTPQQQQQQPSEVKGLKASLPADGITDRPGDKGRRWEQRPDTESKGEASNEAEEDAGRVDDRKSEELYRKGGSKTRDKVNARHNKRMPDSDGSEENKGKEASQQTSETTITSEEKKNSLSIITEKIAKMFKPAGIQVREYEEGKVMYATKYKREKKHSRKGTLRKKIWKSGRKKDSKKRSIEAQVQTNPTESTFSSITKTLSNFTEELRKHMETVSNYLMT